MRNHTCLLDHHQRSHYDTITIGPQGKFHWVLQLINNQKEKLFDSLLEKYHVLNSPNQPNPKPKSICDRSGKPEDTERVFVEKGKTSRSHEIDEKRLHKELGSSDRSGKPERLSEDIRVMHAHDGSGQPDERNSSSTHAVEEQFVPEVNRDIASFNADNEFNRAINEEDIDFNIPGVPHSAVKRSHGVNVPNLIQKIENHPQRQALQSDLQQHRQFNPFSKESQDVIKAAGNTEQCELLDVEPKAQCKDTITIGLKGMMNWVLQLNNSQSVNSFNSLLEKYHVLNSPNQPNPKPKPICDRSGKPEDTEDVFVVKGETSRSHEIDEKGLHEELGSSDRSGKIEKLSENIRVKHVLDGTGQPVEQNSSTAHTVKEQYASEENRDIASFNADNDFNRKINEEDIDFNIPGLPHSTVKQLHSASVRELVQKIENLPNRHALQRDLQQSQSFNPFSQE